MTTYNTGNPIGSTDPRDLYDNAENLDTAMNTPAVSWTDRIGNARQSWAGATGYQHLGDYAAGIQVTTYNQVIRASGEYWRAAAGTVLPYTTTGAGMPESGKFVSVGDAILRADLVNGDGSSLVGFQQSGTGAVVRTAQDKMREAVTPEDFGAVGDGVANDTSAMISAILSLTAGGELRLGFGKTYLISQTIVLTKPVRITGGARENTKIIFSSSGSYLAAPYRCGILALHSLTTAPGYSGDARRSSLCGFTLEMQPGPAGLGGLIAACPIYVNEVDANKFSGDGFSVIAGSGSPIQGNANGSTFTNCSALQNGGSGFFLIGDDANACIFTGARAYVNGAWGFFDSSLLGNTYIGCETDLNTQGAYYSDSAKPNRSVYVGCYAEGNQPLLWLVNPRCLRIGSLGALDNVNGSPGISLTSLPSKNLYLNNSLVLADTEDVANALAGGEFTQIGKDGFHYKRNSGRGLRVRQSLSINYVDIESDGTPSIRFPNSAVFGNVTPARPLFENGLSIGGGGRSAIVGGGAAAPTSGTYDLGAIFLNDAPIAGGFVGWVCVSAGSPGLWKTFGAISA